MSILARKLTISNDNYSNWVPTVETVNGKAFVRLYGFDKTFYRFCTGQALQIGKGKSCSKTMFMKNLLEARNVASVAAWHKFNEELADDNGRRKRQKVRAPKDCDGEVCGQEVRVTAVHGLATMQMTCLFGTKKTDVWVEANESNIDFVVMAVASDIRNNNLDVSGAWQKLKPNANDNGNASDAEVHDPAARGSDDRGSAAAHAGQGSANTSEGSGGSGSQS